MGYIDREALLTHLRECRETSMGSGLAAAVITAIRSFVEEMPVVEAAPPTPGHWIEHDDFLGRTVECSACHSETMGETPYCPVCGAKMDEKDGIRQETRAEEYRFVHGMKKGFWRSGSLKHPAVRFWKNQ